MDSTVSLEIATTILKQIKSLDFFALMAWGAKNFIALPECKKYQGGVSFQVNGLKHKGWVYIQLRHVDDYTISFMNMQGELIHQVDQVYCDMLVEILDWVECK